MNDTINFSLVPTTFPASTNFHYHFIPCLIVVNFLIAVTAISFNLLIILAFAKNPSLRTPSNFLLGGLALVDFFSATIMQPIFCTIMAGRIIHIHSYDDLEHFGYLLFSQVGLFTFSIVTLIITDRFLAVYLHLRYNQLITTRRYAIVIAVIFIVILHLQIADYFSDREDLEVFTYIHMMWVLIGIIFNLAFTFKIIQAIRRHSKQIQAQEQITQSNVQMPRFKKSVHTMYFIVASFLLCYGIQLIHFVIDDITLQFTFSTVFLFGGVLHPIVYCWRIKEIQNTISTIIKCCSHNGAAQETGAS